MRSALRGRTRNGLSWRVGISLLAVLTMGEHRGSPYIESLLSDLARRLRDPLFGGATGPSIDRTFRLAELVVWARPGKGCAS